MAGSKMEREGTKMKAVMPKTATARQEFVREKEYDEKAGVKSATIETESGKVP
jgi:hypothetical protein